jgi:asparagine synthase (glutamine-hydrolysing)
MQSASGRYVLVFNGEIYNHLELRTELERAGRAPVWRGHSDTETVLAGIEAWGIKATLERLVGMFAMGLWSEEQQSLTLARDRFGEKPLYYGRCGHDVVFGSELKALRVHPAFPREIDRGALSLFLRYNYIPYPYSIHPGISKLPPGTYVTFSRERPTAVPTEFWSVRAATPSRSSSRITDTEAVDTLDRLMRRSVEGQMLADVPVGAFLSGGLDSSLVVAMMKAAGRGPVRTFSLGFQEPGFDEANHARAIASYLGTDHTEMYVSPEQARDVIPSLPGIYDEPFADSSQIPTLLVSRLARQHVTVALTGDGADELLGGYRRYIVGRSPLQRLFLLPQSTRTSMAGVLDRVRKSGAFERAVHSPLLHERLDNLSTVLQARTADEIGTQQSTQWKHPEEIVVGGHQMPCVADQAPGWLREEDPTARLMLIDLVSYLPGDILAKVDRAAMSVSLETRVPFLDHRVAEFALSLPMHMKVREGQGKWVLRRVLERYVPTHLFDRPKMGFSVPVSTWLKGPLREWAEELLSEERLRREGYFHPAPIRKKWAEHLDGSFNWHLHLWSVLMFQSWLAAQPK